MQHHAPGLLCTAVNISQGTLEYAVVFKHHGIEASNLNDVF